MPVGVSGQRPPMIWVGGAQGAGKSTWAWQLSRAHDLPLHPVDLWSYDHLARLPAGDSLDDQLARGPEAAADAFESVSRLRLELVLDDIRARDLGAVPAIVEGPQLMPGFSGELPSGWGVWLVPDPGRTRLAREERLAKAESLGGPHGGCQLARSSLVGAGHGHRPARPRECLALQKACHRGAGGAGLARDRGRRRVRGRPGAALCASSVVGPGAQPAAAVREPGS
jgi:hypothetical protein